MERMDETKRKEKWMEKKVLKKAFCENYLMDSVNWEITKNIKELGLQIAHLKNTEIYLLRAWEGTKPLYGPAMDPYSSGFQSVDGYVYNSPRWYPVLYFVHWVDENGINASKVYRETDSLIDVLKKDRRWVEKL